MAAEIEAGSVRDDGGLARFFDGIGGNVGSRDGFRDFHVVYGIPIETIQTICQKSALTTFLPRRDRLGPFFRLGIHRTESHNRVEGRYHHPRLAVEKIVISSS